MMRDIQTIKLEFPQGMVTSVENHLFHLPIDMLFKMRTIKKTLRVVFPKKLNRYSSKQ